MTVNYNIQAMVDFPSRRTELIELSLATAAALPFQQQFCCTTKGITSVSVPPDQFTWANRVRDQIAYAIEGEEIRALNQLIDDARLPRPRCIVFLLESPHSYEYDYEPRFAPLAPLQQQSSRKRFETYIPQILAAVGPFPDGTDIVLCNPVPYQTSLHRMMVDPKPPLQRPVRNLLWRELFAGGFAADLIGRLHRYHPDVVLNACTSSLRKAVGTVVSRLPDHWPESPLRTRIYRCNHHPSVWRAGTRFEQVRPGAHGLASTFVLRAAP